MKVRIAGVPEQIVSEPDGWGVQRFYVSLLVSDEIMADLSALISSGGRPTGVEVLISLEGLEQVTDDGLGLFRDWFNDNLKE